jgi:hypothetical protein
MLLLIRKSHSQKAGGEKGKRGKGEKAKTAIFLFGRLTGNLV